MPLRSIFISYRRNDSEGEAGRLFDDLVTHFGTHSVFMDVAAIEPGQDFRKAIDKSVATCSVLLALIGQEWLGSKDAMGRRRLEDPNDFVRLELALALQRDIPAVPVLVRGARMPQAEQLPVDLKELAFRNAVELTHARWKSDVALLIHALRPYMDPIDAIHAVANDQSASIQHSDPSKAAPMPETPSLPRSVAPAHAINDELTSRVGRELAAHIGPIAELITRRAAKQHNSVEQLCEAIAAEIENDADRSQFLKACRRFSH
jgi:hypothetical protein